MNAECNVNLNQVGCTNEPVRTSCYGCGNAACRACSEIVKDYAGRGRVRLCRDCMEDRKGDFTRYPVGSKWRTIGDDS